MKMNEKIDWKRKLTSRKFWVAIIGFVTTIMIALNIDKMTVEQVAAIISAMGTLVAYIIGEGLTDAAHIKNENEKEGE
nr:MAG TPA: holin [Caudoviricetes sp.]